MHIHRRHGTEEVLEALRQSEEKFRTIYEQSPIAIEIYDTKGSLIDANTRCLKLFGIDNIEEVKGFKLFDDPHISEEAKKKLKENIPIQYESRFDFDLVRKESLYITPKTGVAFLNIYISPIFSLKKETIGYLVQVEEITDRITAQQALLESEEKFRLLFENSADAHILYKGEKFIDCNTACIKMLGLILKTNSSHFIPVRSLPLIKKMVSPAARKQSL